MIFYIYIILSFLLIQINEISGLKKKICFLVTDASSFNVLCRGQLEYIRDNSNFDITLICGGNDKQFDILYKRKVGKVINAKFHRQPSLIKDIKSLAFLIAYLSFNRFDIIVYSTPKALLLGSLASTITIQKNRIALIRGRVYENYSGSKRKMYEALDRLTLFNSNKAVFIAKSLKDAYSKDGLVNSENSVIIGSGSSNGVDIFKYKSIKPLKNIVLKEQSSSFRIIMVGRICFDKGLYDLKKILKNIGKLDIKILLVGNIQDKTSGIFLEELMKNYKNIEHIPFTTDIVSYFQQADLHLFLSHREGFGNVALEAASCGIPTFAYDVVGVRDSVKNDISGQRFNFKDTLTISKAIIEAANDSNFKDKYPFARDWAIKNFEQKKVWQNYLNFYLEQL